MRTKANAVGIALLLMGIPLLIIASLWMLKTQVIPSATRNTELDAARPYFSAIAINDISLRTIAANVTRNCKNIECNVVSVFRYVVDHYRYIADPRGVERIQQSNETMLIGGGDCEDLTILTNSLLENIGIKTYLVLAKEHAYGLVCGIDTQSLADAILDDRITQFVTENPTFVRDENKLYRTRTDAQDVVLAPGSSHFFGSDGSAVEPPVTGLTYKYTVSSTSPVDIYFIASDKDYTAFTKNRAFMQYPDCGSQKVTTYSNSCTIDRYGGLLISNMNGRKSANVQYDIQLLEDIALPQQIFNTSVTYYTVDNQTCIVLDSTTGTWGYPGYSPGIDGSKVAVDPQTQTLIHLS